MKKLFLIIGAPGSGKTTDAQLIAQKNPSKIIHYSTGDLLREEINKGSSEGKIIADIIAKGNLVPLDIVVNTIITAMRNAPKDTIIIDGYPRSVEQMQALDEKLKSQNDVKLIQVIEVEVSKEVARERVLGRARGADDNAEVFNNRMKVYLEPLQEIEAFYSKQNLLHRINGERTIETIVDEMNDFVLSHI